MLPRTGKGCLLAMMLLKMQNKVVLFVKFSEQNYFAVLAFKRLFFLAKHHGKLKSFRFSLVCIVLYVVVGNSS